MAKILIVEDDKILARMYQVKFTNAGLTIELAENGQDGLAKMKSFHPDVVLMDLMMPIMDGFTALTRAKEDPEIKDIPIIVLSNLSMAEDARKAIKMGALEHIVKSDLTPAQVLETLFSIIPSLKSAS